MRRTLVGRTLEARIWKVKRHERESRECRIANDNYTAQQRHISYLPTPRSQSRYNRIFVVVSCSRNGYQERIVHHSGLYVSLQPLARPICCTEMIAQKSRARDGF